MHTTDEADTQTPPPLNRHDYGVLGCLLGLTILLFARYLFVSPPSLIFPASGFQYGTDLLRENWSIFRYTADTFHQYGQFPLWRPYLLAGAPLLGHPVAPITYPPNWLTLILPLPLAFNVLMVLHFWWAGTGIYLYLRGHVRREAAFVGALVFAFTPRLFAHLGAGHLELIKAVSWAPWALLAFERYWTTHDKRWTIVLGTALAVMAIDNGQYAAMTGIVLGGCTLWLVLRGRLPALRSALVCWSVTGIIALGLSAAQLLPLAEFLPLTRRVGLTQSETLGGLEPALLVNTLLRPSIVVTESYVYLGVLAGVLVMIALLSRPFPTRWVIGGLLILLLALGSRLPLPIYPLLVRYVPTFAFFRTPGRFYPFFALAVAVLAAYGYERWINRVRFNFWLRPLLAGLCALYLLVFVAGAKLPFLVFPQVILLPAAVILLSIRPRRITRAALIMLLLIDLGYVDSELTAPKAESTVVGPDRLVSFLKSAVHDDERIFAPYGELPETAPVAFNLHMADGYDPFIIRNFYDLAALSIGCNYEPYVVGAPPTRADYFAAQQCKVPVFQDSILGLLDIRYVLLPAAHDTPIGQLVFSDDQDQLRVYDRGPGQGRAFGVSRTTLADKDQCLKTIQAVDTSQEAILEVPAPDSSVQSQSVPKVVSRQTIVNGEIFTVENGGLLVRSEVWAPGWVVTIDNQPATVWRVDCALQGVWLGPGTHVVRFEYRPVSLYVGTAISVLTLLGITIWLLADRFFGRSPLQSEGNKRV